MTLRVLHATGEKNWRGGEIQILLLIKYCQAIDPGIEHVLCCRPGSAVDLRAREQQIPVANLAFSNGIDVMSAWGLQRLCQREKIDIIHCHSPNAHGIAILSETLGNRARIIATKRTVFPVKSNWLSKQKYRKTDLVIGISPEAEASVQDSVHTMTEVIPSIYDPQEYRPVNFSEVLADIPQSHVIGYVAAISHEKDPQTFIDVAQVLSERRPDAAFVWIGDGPLREELTTTIAKRGLENHVFLAGHQDNVLDWISALDIFFFPSKSEGLGSSVLQAFHCRVPVVTSDAGGLKSLITHGVNGLQAPIGDTTTFVEHLKNLLDNSAYSEWLTENGTKTLQSFAPDRVVPRVISAYRRLASLTK